MPRGDAKDLPLQQFHLIETERQLRVLFGGDEAIRESVSADDDIRAWGRVCFRRAGPNTPEQQRHEQDHVYFENRF